MKMPPVIIWIHELVDSHGRQLIGGVQTYIFDLKRVLEESGRDVYIFAIRPQNHMTPSEPQIVFLTRSEWRRGIKGETIGRLKLNQRDNIHIVANAHCSPLFVGDNAIGIQHGIYWDRPTQQVNFPIDGLETIANLVRTWKGSRVIKKFKKTVCVDLVFPTVAACVYSPLNWNDIFYIPNSAPNIARMPTFSDNVTRVVFCRRFVKHRGTEILVKSMKKIYADGWKGQLHIIGAGPEEAYIKSNFETNPLVKIYCLPYQERLDAFDESSLALIPTLSTEGTSLSCIEAFSKGSLVISTGVGGLGNLVIDNYNGLLSKPSTNDFQKKIASVLSGDVKIADIKRRGFETFVESFNANRWSSSWLEVIDSCR